MQSEHIFWSKDKIAAMEEIETDQGTWVGGIEDGRPHGNGTMTFKKSHSVYKEYRGYWGENGPTGSQGLMEYKNGHLYDGSWLDGKRSGKGLLYHGSKLLYTGRWENGLKAGKGTERGINTDDGTQVEYSYSGGFSEGLYHGSGKLAVGAVEYTGTWVDGQKHGKIEIKTSENQKKVVFYYLGEVCKSKSIGEDNIRFNYEGNVSPDDKPHGKGKMTYLNYRANNSQATRIYKGEFFEGKKNGPGHMLYFVKRPVGERDRDYTNKKLLNNAV